MNCIVLFTKAPFNGQVKTRLVQPGSLDASEAALLYRAFLSDVLETVGRYMRKRGVELVLSYTPHEGLAEIRRLIGRLSLPVKVSSFDLQEGSMFDQRISNAFSKAFLSGYEAAVVIGGDLPTISERHLDEAFRLLDKSSSHGGGVIVVGPGLDGGVYLIGLRGGTPFTFNGVFERTDGTDISLSLLEKRAEDLSIHILKTSLHYDVDIPEDLEVLRRELAKDPDLAPHTRRVLSALGLMPADGASPRRLGERPV
ncbi:DUF2064 domain-containing protein [Candidatus Bathyarchaeota archaeon]|nr:DUF2064 domain-containing protein [Candidatus Bathyarchaeota archaeon]